MLDRVSSSRTTSRTRRTLASATSDQDSVSLRVRHDPRLDSCPPRDMMTAEFGRAANKDRTRGDVQMIRGSFSRAAFVIAACCSGALLGLSAADAADFSAEYVFGDSLSDNGNLAAALGTNFPNPPSFDNSFTNGKVAVQLLAESLGLSANASLWLTSPTPAGTNYAVGGATSAASAIGGSMNINLPSQVDAYSASVSGHADPNALYVVMIGGNDVRNAALQGTGAGAITDGVDTEVTEISTLGEEGAKHFLVVNVPNVGIIPEFAQENPGFAHAPRHLAKRTTQTSQGTAHPGADAGPWPQRSRTSIFFDFNAAYPGPSADSWVHEHHRPPRRFTRRRRARRATQGRDTGNIDGRVLERHSSDRPSAGPGGRGLQAAVPEPSTWAMLLIGFSG